MAQRHDLFVLVHPHKAVAAASLIFGGVIERHPAIRFCLFHAGGCTPFQAGSFRHGGCVRQEPKIRLKGDQAESLDRLIFDSVTHAPGPLRFLLNEVGPERVVFGTDYPFDMGTTRGVEEMEEAIDDPAIRATILEGNARRFFAAPAEV